MSTKKNTTMIKQGVSRQIGIVKWAVIVASLVASLLGARLAAVDDAQSEAPTTTQVVIVEENGSTHLLELPAVPTAISPDSLPPVARSQSSR